jgi:L-fuconolactonase
MPNFPIVDAHVHLWDPDRFRIPWIDGDALLGRRYLLEEYREHTAGVDVAAMVYLQVEVAPAYGLLEAQFVAGLAREDPRIQAIVAWAPLEDGHRARSYLDALVSVSPLVKGVRRIVQGETDPRFCLRPDFVAGTRLLAEYGLSCDICIFHHQLAATIELVRQCPEVSFILDHLGKPAIKDGLLDPWRSEMAELAALSNVICKVSGAVTEADHLGWQVSDLAPYVEHALAVFGEDRVAFGGDWPVVTQAAAYPQWVAALDELTAGMSETAKRKLWADNARRFYRI